MMIHSIHFNPLMEKEPNMRMIFILMMFVALIMVAVFTVAEMPVHDNVADIGTYVSPDTPDDIWVPPNAVETAENTIIRNLVEKGSTGTIAEKCANKIEGMYSAGTVSKDNYFTIEFAKRHPAPVLKFGMPGSYSNNAANKTKLRR
jgi:hypothetical protein